MVIKDIHVFGSVQSCSRILQGFVESFMKGVSSANALDVILVQGNVLRMKGTRVTFTGEVKVKHTYKDLVVLVCKDTKIVVRQVGGDTLVSIGDRKGWAADTAHLEIVELLTQ